MCPVRRQEGYFQATPSAHKGGIRSDKISQDQHTLSLREFLLKMLKSMEKNAVINKS
jgi:hypothetical protein